MGEDPCSLLKKGCNKECCKHGTPYVLSEERDRIVAETGKDVFLPGIPELPPHYIVGRNLDGTPRDLDRDPCPFFEQGLCVLQDLGLKPADCRLYPFYPIDGGIGARCCEAATCIDGDYRKTATAIFELLPLEHRRGIIASSAAYGFPLMKLTER